MRIVPQAALFKTYSRRSARCARAENKRGFLRGLERVAITSLKLLSLVTLLRNTKESNAHPGRGKILIIKQITLRVSGKEYIKIIASAQRKF